jgi:hypothetical protein
LHGEDDHRFHGDSFIRAFGRRPEYNAHRAGIQ